MRTFPRYRAALTAAGIHFVCTAAVAGLAAGLVFGMWYPFPYRELAGGKELFLLVVAVDVICGPLLTAVLFNPSKSRAELWRDLGLVAMIQLAALGYGLHTVWQARPLFLAHEVDRFVVIAAVDVDSAALAALSPDLKPGWTSGPVVIALRDPIDSNERNKVLMESAMGARDYSARPEFYLPYNDANALRSLKRAKPLAVFLQKHPTQQAAATRLASKKGADIAQWLYLPVMARQDWVAVLDKQGQIQGFLKGDGF